MYSEITQWKTGLCDCECESNFLSWVVPCHVYAKLTKAYASNLLIYLCLWINIQFMYCYIRYMYSYKCPAYSTDYCIRLGDSCEMHYMNINGATVSCVTIDNVCTHRKMSCIDAPTVHVNIGLALFFIGLFDTILSCMHYQLRKQIREKYQLSPDNDCLASTLCSTCGLSQEYREIIII